MKRNSHKAGSRPLHLWPDGSKLVGYARVSTDEQKTDLQLDALRAVKCRRIFEDKASGANWTDRDGLDRALAAIRPGDRLAVWRLDRIGRSIRQILAIIEELDERGASLIGLSEGFDTSTEAGELHSTMLAMIAHIERRMIVSRTKAGLQAAKARGQRLGRPPKMTQEQVAEARRLVASGQMKAEAVAARYGVGRATMFRYFQSLRLAA
ncbi:MAG: recombinase family protein [Sphingobium sp.]|nr:recombinase family protein [Sphingobium sp.]